MRLVSWIVIGIGLCGLSGTCAAGELPADWPEAVKQALGTCFPEAGIQEQKQKEKDGQGVLELRLTDKLNQGEAYEVRIGLDGRVLKEQKHRFPSERLPQAVLEAFRVWAGSEPGGGAWEVEREDGKARVFEVRKRHGGGEKKYKARFAEDGGFLDGDAYPGGGQPAAPAPKAETPGKPAEAAPEPQAETKPEPKVEPKAEEEAVDPDVLRKVKRLIRGTLDEELEERQKAWKDMREMGNLIVPGLVELIRQESTSDEMLDSIVIALGDSKDPRAGPALVEVLGHKSVLARRKAARALGASKFKEASEALQKRFADPQEDGYVRLYAAAAAAKLKSPAGFEALKELMKASDAGVRARAIFELGVNGGPAYAEQVVLGLKDQEALVRMDAVEALRRAKAKDKSVLGALIEATRDEDYKVRAAVVEALKELAGQKFTEPEEWRTWWAEQNGAKKTEAEPAGKTGAKDGKEAKAAKTEAGEEEAAPEGEGGVK